MAQTILKNTPIHAVIEVTGAAANEIIDISALAIAGRQTAGAPIVNIKAIRWSIPTGTATIERNSVLLWSLSGAYDFQFDGFVDNVENDQDIEVTLPAGGGTVVLELRKVGGYGDEQHIPTTPSSNAG